MLPAQPTPKPKTTPKHKQNPQNNTKNKQDPNQDNHKTKKPIKQLS